MGFYLLYQKNIYRVNGLYQQWTTYALKSKCVSEIHFSGICRSKFTDVASKKLNLLKKTAVDNSAWIKTCNTKEMN